MAEIFSNLVKDISLQIEETKSIPYRINKGIRLRTYHNKTSENYRDKEETSQAAKGKIAYLYRNNDPCDGKFLIWNHHSQHVMHAKYSGKIVNCEFCIW